MARFDMMRVAWFALGLAAAGLLAGCERDLSWTNVTLSGPADKVEALIAQHDLHAAPAKAHVEKLPNGRERATFHKPGGIPAGQLVDLGKEAARAGVNFEFSSGSE